MISKAFTLLVSPKQRAKVEAHSLGANLIK